MVVLELGLVLVAGRVDALRDPMRQFYSCDPKFSQAHSDTGGFAHETQPPSPERLELCAGPWVVAGLVALAGL